MNKKTRKRATTKIVACYNQSGELIETTESIHTLVKDDILEGGIRQALSNKKQYKGIYYRYFKLDEEVPKIIDINLSCIVNGVSFSTLSDAARHIGVSRQAISAAKQRGNNFVNGFTIEWR